MIDREKEYILKKLQEALEKAENDGCFYAEIRRPIVFDAIALLKEQEPVPPGKQSDGNPGKWASWWYVCGICGRGIDYHDRFCRHCGRGVKWNEQS